MKKVKLNISVTFHVLLQLLHLQYHVYSGSDGTETTLQRRVNPVSKNLEAFEGNSSKEFDSNTEKGDSTAVIAVTDFW